ncbi:TadE/TadG family type IV pilus assembly protein [Streptomyces sp. NPDC059506]|uniref:TadE/TadG family type IV pilus assembly protein n=1 Tax=Streptomyces TaxID=1883 RepID=UPI0015F8D546|nr:TadE/TadG family type IV pilus assembly protein [Streptomyces sp. SCUT-3]QMV21967.1 septum formation initiator [Streptomyces sp. SCUT-3]
MTGNAPRPPARRDPRGGRGSRAGRGPCGGRGPHGGRERGSASVEFLGFLPLLLLVTLAGVQLGLVAYAASQAGTAARAAARAESREELELSGSAAGLAAMSSWLRDGATVTVSGDEAVRATVSVRVPSVVPGWEFDPVERSAVMPGD